MYKSEVVWDLEANGLIKDSTEVWCISLKDITNGQKFNLNGSNLTRREVLRHFEGVTNIIGHNIIAFDIPMIKKFYDIDLIELLGRDKITDTLLWSQVLYPDRPMPRGCPTSITNPVTKKSKKIGPHGLEAWGYRVGHKKIEIHDWLTYTPDILDRCDVDVDINELVYYELLKEAGIRCD
jgi:hypothetical protein